MVAHEVTYKDWDVDVDYDANLPDGSRGPALKILMNCDDTYEIRPHLDLTHTFPIPADFRTDSNWARWIFDRILDVERHESMEWFKVNGVRALAPDHSPGADFYRTP